MIKLKDILKENLHQAVDFCESIDGSSDEQLDKMITGYLYSLSISSMIIEKFKALKTKEARKAFLHELREALNEDGEFSGVPPGGAQA